MTFFLALAYNIYSYFVPGLAFKNLATFGPLFWETL